jgi:hypothetical protein
VPGASRRVSLDTVFSGINSFLTPPRLDNYPFNDVRGVKEMSSSQRKGVNELLKEYVSPSVPLGAWDSDNIDDPECFAKLYEWDNTSFAGLLSGSQIIIGRRGSGKSALLNAVRDKQKFIDRIRTEERSSSFPETYGLGQQSLKLTQELFLQIDLPAEIDELKKTYQNVDFLPTVETLAKYWYNRIFIRLGQQIHEKDMKLWSRLSKDLKDYVNPVIFPNIGAANNDTPMTPERFADGIKNFLSEQKRTAIITFDSLEEYLFNDAEILFRKGLFRCVGKLVSQQNTPISVKLCLPAELYPLIKNQFSNPDKDLATPQFLHWNSRELMRIATHRLRVFLEIYKPEEYKQIAGLKLNSREDLQTFWDRYLPKKILNASGQEEDSFRYILRHTQMLPRQVILILNSILSKSKTLESGRPADAEVIREEVRKKETVFLETIFSMFRTQYPKIDDVCRASFSGMSRVITSGELQTIHTQKALRLMKQMNLGHYSEFQRMLLSIGALGIVETTEETEVYTVGWFEFNTEHELPNAALYCVHPIFSGVYRCPTPAGTKPILTRDIGSATSGDN